MGLLEYAQLPWETWKCNAQAKDQFKFLQSTDGFIAPGVFLTEEVVSYVFNLPMEGATKLDRVPIKILEQEFGVPDNPRGYYVIKKVKDSDRRTELEWFLENVLLLVKSEYMSERNYSYLYAAEKGKKVAWAFVLHQKIMMAIKEKDKRKVHKTSRLGPVLSALFTRINNLEILFGSKMQSSIKPFTRKGKRQVDDDDDEPPRTKQGRTDPVVDQKKVMKELMGIGYPESEALRAAAQYKAMEDPLFETPFQGATEKEMSTPGSTQKKGLKLKLGKAKVEKSAERSTEGVQYKPKEIPEEVTLSEAKKAWKVMDNFFLQQQANTQIERRKQRELENRLAEMERQLERQEVKSDGLKKLEENLQK